MNPDRDKLEHLAEQVARELSVAPQGLAPNGPILTRSVWRARFNHMVLEKLRKYPKTA